MKWYRITLSREGWGPFTYEKCGEDFEDAYALVKAEPSVGRSWSGRVDAVEIDGPTVVDRSFSIDELAQRANAVHDNLPF